jgi:lipid-A-disaccharide synthase
MRLRIGLVAGEASGDQLGAGLIRAITARCPDTEFAGVGGPGMAAAGQELWWPAEKLSVMGLAEVARHLPGLLRLRRQLRDRLLAWRPDVVVGIDSPEFNLGLERMIRSRGVPTAHYVSPSIWAWRPRRLRKIRRAAAAVLCLFPFETAPYTDIGMRAEFVGHPLADRLPMEPDRAAARHGLELGEEETVVAVLPGSRATELRYLGEDFAGAVGWLAARRPALRFVAPMASDALSEQFSAQIESRAPGVPVRFVRGESHSVMAAADVALLASGTAALEACLIKRPMVVAYRVAPFTRWLLQAFRMLNIDRFALPNLLAGRDLVPEILQDRVTPEALGTAVLRWLDDPAAREVLARECQRIHEHLRQGADERAAQAVLSLCAGGEGLKQ